MKKTVVTLLAAIMLLSLCAFALSGCGNNDKSKERRDTGTQQLTYDKRYIISSEARGPQDEQTYYVFKDNGTGEYTYYYDHSQVYIRHYTVKFTYLIIDDTVVCFYDSIEFAPNHTYETIISSTWTATFGFSENIIMSTGGTLYICEDYLPEIPNFGT